MEPKKEINLWWFGLTILIIVVLVIFLDIGELRVWVEKAGVWGPLVFIILKASTHIIMPLSGSPLYPLVGLLFGFWPGILYTIAGDVIGVSTNFFLSRKFGRALISKFISNQEESLLNRIINYMGDTRGFLHTALTFFATPELLSYAAGLSKLRYITFISILTPIGIVASSILVFFGSIFGIQGQPLWLTLGFPLLAIFVVTIGGAFFIQGILRKR